MSGYSGFSKSNNACLAESEGRYPASVAAKMLRVPVEFVRAQHTGEWHHTSKHYNATKYYDLEAIAGYLETAEGWRAKRTARGATHRLHYLLADGRLDRNRVTAEPICQAIASLVDEVG